jgi:hypothetical protein
MSFIMVAGNSILSLGPSKRTDPVRQCSNIVAAVPCNWAVFAEQILLEVYVLDTAIIAPGSTNLRRAPLQVGTALFSLKPIFAIERRMGDLEQSNYLTTKTYVVICFVLFLFPGFPKDRLCYVLGLSRLSVTTLLLVSVIGRMPGTYLLMMQDSLTGYGN